MTNKDHRTREEEADEIVRRLQTPPAPNTDLGKIIIPMIRKILPESIAREILGVQPMSVNIAEALKIKYNVKHNKSDKDEV